MAKKATPSRELTLDALRGFHSGTKIELSNLEQMKDYIEDVLASIDYIESQFPKGALKTFKEVKAQALKVREALPCLIAFQKAFVKCCGSVIEDASREQTGRSPSSRASRATTPKKAPAKKQAPKKGRVK
jgi:hypothetical protein